MNCRAYGTPGRRAAIETTGRTAARVRGNALRWGVVTLLSLLCVGVIAADSAVADDDPAAPLKAAFLYHFISFVDWPDSAVAEDVDSFGVAVLGPDPFGNLLEKTFGTKDESGLPFRFHRLEDIEDPGEIHILYVSKGYRGDLRRALSRFDGAPVLTVSDREGFASSGGMIGFFLENGKLRFEVNRSRVEKSSLSMSSRMLVLAEIVEERE